MPESSAVRMPAGLLHQIVGTNSKSEESTSLNTSFQEDILSKKTVSTTATTIKTSISKSLLTTNKSNYTGN